MNSGVFCFGIIIGIIVVLAVLAILRSRGGSSGGGTTYPTPSGSSDMGKRAVGYEPDAKLKGVEKQLKPEKSWASETEHASPPHVGIEKRAVTDETHTKPGKLGFDVPDRDDDAKPGKLGGSSGGKFGGDDDRDVPAKGGKISASPVSDRDDDDAKPGKLGGGKGGKLG